MSWWPPGGGRWTWVPPNTHHAIGRGKQSRVRMGTATDPGRPGRQTQRRTAARNTHVLWWVSVPHRNCYGTNIRRIIPVSNTKKSFVLLLNTFGRLSSSFKTPSQILLYFHRNHTVNIHPISIPSFSIFAKFSKHGMLKFHLMHFRWFKPLKLLLVFINSNYF